MESYPYQNFIDRTIVIQKESLFKKSHFLLGQSDEKFIDKIIVSKGMILDRVETLAHNIIKDFSGQKIIFLCVMKGAIQFNSALTEKIISLKALNVDAAYIKEIRDAGYKNVTEDQLVTFKAQGIDKKYIEKERENILSSVGFPKELYDRRGFQLSGGEQQRAALARLLATNPVLLILDEPFSSLDPSSQSWLKSKLKELNHEGVTILISSHDLKHVTEICSRILLLEDGLIVKDANTSNETLIELEKYFKVYDDHIWIF